MPNKIFQDSNFTWYPVLVKNDIYSTAMINDKENDKYVIYSRSMINAYVLRILCFSLRLKTSKRRQILLIKYM